MKLHSLKSSSCFCNTAPAPLPVYDLVEADLWDQLPDDLLDLLALLPRADLYLQDEMQVAFHPTLTRVW